MRKTLLLSSLLVLGVISTAPAGEIGVPDNNPGTGAACNVIPWRASFMGGEARYQALVPATMMGGKPALLYELSFAPCQGACDLDRSDTSDDELVLGCWVHQILDPGSAGFCDVAFD